MVDFHSLLKEIGKGERIALSKLAVEFLERNRRPIRIAIDIAIWQFQNQAGQGGQNPALRIFYYRLLRLLALPIHPLFVYDGPKKPLAKRNKVVQRYCTTTVHNEMSKTLLQLFRFPFQTAPGEAEAECALLQREGIVDAVMSQDVDALMWGSTMTLRDWSPEGTRGNKNATHVNVLRAEEIKSNTKLDPDGMILVAIFSGGDYAPEGLPGFGPGLACETARAGFGSELLEVMSKGDKAGLTDWKVRLQFELEQNYSGYFKTKHRSVKLPEEFPDETLLRYYTNPEVSSTTDLQRLRRHLQAAWDGEIDTKGLRDYASRTFNWQHRGGACKFIRSLAPALLSQRLLRGHKNMPICSSDAILERRMHFVSDGMPELRVTAVPEDIVGVNIADEEDNPEYVQAMEEAAAAEEEIDGIADLDEPEDKPPETASDTPKPRKKAPWDPRNPEKFWIPETIVKLGVPHLVEEWEQKRRDMLMDPRKFIANKARKINPSTAGTQTKTIHAYFTTAKPTVARQSERTLSPKKALDEAVDQHDDRNVQATSTPTRRRAKAKIMKAMSAPTSSINAFSLASQSRSQAASKASNLPPYANTSIHETLANAPNKHPIRRSRKPMQKSKTLPTTTVEPILISSSPPAHPNLRSSTPPPPRHARCQTAGTADTNPSLDSDSDSLPSPSQLFQSIQNQTSRRSTTSASTCISTTSMKTPRQPIPALGQIFGRHSARVTTAAADNVEFDIHIDSKDEKMVLSRDNLPGTWRELVNCETSAGSVGGAGKKGRMPRVSLVDLTDV